LRHRIAPLVLLRCRLVFDGEHAAEGLGDLRARNVGQFDGQTFDVLQRSTGKAWDSRRLTGAHAAFAFFSGLFWIGCLTGITTLTGSSWQARSMLCLPPVAGYESSSRRVGASR